MNHPERQLNNFNPVPMVKVGSSRQVAIPKRVYEELHLRQGDYLEVKVKNDQLVLTPKVFIEKRLAEGLRDLKEGKTIGPFTNMADAASALER